MAVEEKNDGDNENRDPPLFRIIPTVENIDPDAGNEMGKQRQTGDHLMREPLMAWFSPMIVE